MKKVLVAGHDPEETKYLLETIESMEKSGTKEYWVYTTRALYHIQNGCIVEGKSTLVEPATFEKELVVGKNTRWECLEF